MTDLNARPWTGAWRFRGRGTSIGRFLVAVWTVLVLAGVADARISIRRHFDYDRFYFHAQYSGDPFDPADGFTIDIWNCASGEMPLFIADREPIMACFDAASADIALADLAYSIDLPGGSCFDHGRSCYYRNPDVNVGNGGLRDFRVQYSSRSHGNRIWLVSYGDLSLANQARMLILIKINGRPRAILQGEFSPLHNGGWISR